MSYPSNFVLACLCLITFCLSTGIHGQSTNHQIEQLISEERIEDAQKLINERITTFRNNNQLDSLSGFPEFIGKLEATRTSNSKALDKAIDFLNQLELWWANSTTLYKGYLSLNDLYISLGDD